MVQKHDAGLKEALCAIIQTYHNDLEALTVGLRNFARSRLSEASYSDLMHCLVQSQVLTICVPLATACNSRAGGLRPGLPKLNAAKASWMVNSDI